MSFARREKRMKQLLIIISLGLCMTAFGQNFDEVIKGNVSYISTQNVYVQFVNTDGFQIGDTLFILKNNELQPALIINNMSSISCVGSLIDGNILAVSNPVYAKKKKETVPLEVLTQKTKEAISVNDQAIASGSKNSEPKKPKGALDGRISLSTYLNNTSDSTVNSIYRLNLSFNAEHIANSNFSAECYMSLTKKNTYSPVISMADSLTLINYQNNSPLDLKIYNLAVKYDLNKTMSLLFGRKININLANIGAVDGLQFENTGKVFSYGAVVGSRPDTYTYWINPYLFQFGAYIGHQLKTKNGYMQTSVAVFNQTNNLLTDRRFIYIQHSNSLLKNLDFFGSAELDLFGLANNQPATTFNLTSTYLSFQWRPWKQLSMSLSYDARRNIYYYETYKNYIDSVLDKETRQGLRFQTRYRLFKNITWGGNAGYRFATPTSNASSNGYTYLTFSQIPFGMLLTLDFTALNTTYLNGIIYGGSLSHDFLDGKIFTELIYRHVDYTSNTTSTYLQNIGELNLSWSITKKLLLSADLEATFNPDNNFQWRAFINLSQRF